MMMQIRLVCFANRRSAWYVVQDYKNFIMLLAPERENREAEQGDR